MKKLEKLYLIIWSTRKFPEQWKKTDLTDYREGKKTIIKTKGTRKIAIIKKKGEEDTFIYESNYIIIGETKKQIEKELEGQIWDGDFENEKIEIWEKWYK